MRQVTSYMLLVILLVATLSAPISAQVPTGTIAGTVTDPSGAVVTQATITVTNKSNGLTRVVNTGSDGIYSVASLPAGSYEVKIEATGFAASVATAEGS